MSDMKTVEEKQKDEVKQDILNKYKHLIGVCFNAGDASYVKITSIEYVEEPDIGIKGFVISPREDVLPIRFEIYAIVSENFITDNYISKKRFSALFDMVVERLKEDYGINNYI